MWDCPLNQIKKTVGVCEISSSLTRKMVYPPDHPWTPLNAANRAERLLVLVMEAGLPAATQENKSQVLKLKGKRKCLFLNNLRWISKGVKDTDQVMTLLFLQWPGFFVLHPCKSEPCPGPGTNNYSLVPTSCCFHSAWRDTAAEKNRISSGQV